MDKYDAAIEYLSKNPHRIYDAWNLPTEEGGCLFQYADRNGSTFGSPGVGCLTQIRNTNGERVVEGRPDLTQQIAADERIPKNAHNITVNDLHVFAEWQRLIDIELNR